MINFKSSEFDSPDVEGSGVMMDDNFLEMLDQARTAANIPFIITSGYRTEDHNKLIGGVDGSAHTKGHAVDIACRDSVSRHTIITNLLAAGFNRIGIASTFIHVDNDPNKSPNVIWTY